MNEPIWVYWIAIAALVALAGCWRPARVHWQRRVLARARRDFRFQRERLEMKFVQLAAMDDDTARRPGAEPGDDVWEHCYFGDDVAYVRSRGSGELAAFVAVTVGIDAYDPAATGTGELAPNRRAGTAVFRWGGSHWETDGRLMFNLSPYEAIRLHRDDLELVE
jgi:hypothetical protein